MPASNNLLEILEGPLLCLGSLKLTKLVDKVLLFDFHFWIWFEVHELSEKVDNVLPFFEASHHLMKGLDEWKH